MPEVLSPLRQASEIVDKISLHRKQLHSHKVGSRHLLLSKHLLEVPDNEVDLHSGRHQYNSHVRHVRHQFPHHKHGKVSINVPLVDLIQNNVGVLLDFEGIVNQHLEEVASGAVDDGRIRTPPLLPRNSESDCLSKGLMPLTSHTFCQLHGGYSTRLAHENHAGFWRS